MFKLYIALALVAVAAAKPNWPLSYSGLSYDGLSYDGLSYPVGAYPHGYPTPLVNGVVAPAPIVKTVAPLYPEVAPIAPLSHVSPIAPIGYPAGLANSYLPYSAGVPFIVKKK